MYPVLAPRGVFLEPGRYATGFVTPDTEPRLSRTDSILDTLIIYSINTGTSAHPPSDDAELTKPPRRLVRRLVDKVWDPRRG